MPSVHGEAFDPECRQCFGQSVREVRNLGLRKGEWIRFAVSRHVERQRTKLVLKAIEQRDLLQRGLRTCVEQNDRWPGTGAAVMHTAPADIDEMTGVATQDPITMSGTQVTSGGKRTMRTTTSSITMTNGHTSTSLMGVSPTAAEM